MLDLERICDLVNQRRPGHTLPQDLYNSPEAFKFDLDAIFGQSWILAGFTCEIPRPRGYLAVSVGGSPVVITRDGEGVYRAFHNSCRHRGAQVCAEGTGGRARLTCPYHQWVYDLDGRLVHARMPETFERAEHGLRPVHLENVAGALFVCLAETPPSFARFRADLEPLLAPHRLEEAKIAFQNTLVERGNWKLVMENARECYHCGVSHPELCLTFPIGASTDGHFAVAQDPHYAAFAARVEEAGLGKGPFLGPWWQVERFPLNKGHVGLTIDGALACRKPMVEGAGDIGSLRWAIEPHSFCHSTADTTVYFSAMPTAAGETVVTCKWLVHKDAVEGVDYDVEHLTALWNVTNLQDRDLVEVNQRGVNSVGYAPGPYSLPDEAYVQRFADWYCDKAMDYIAARTGVDARPIELRGAISGAVENSPEPADELPASPVRAPMEHQ